MLIASSTKANFTGLGRSPDSINFLAHNSVAANKIKGTELYNDFMTRFGIEYGMFGVVENSASRWASVSLFRGPSTSEFQLDELEILRFLTPHIRRAFKLHFQFSEANAKSTNLESAVDALSSGVVFLGINGEIVSMNDAASRIFSERDGLFASLGRLRAERPSESDLLRKAIVEAASTSNGTGLPSRLPVQVSRRTRPPLQIVISPTRDRRIDTPKPVAAVALTNDASHRSQLSSHSFTERFGLTPAECRVAFLLGEGRSPRAISESIGVTFNTVRSQIKSIFSKTGVKRQGELIRLLLNHT